MRDIELASTSPDIEWERYQLVNTDALQIFARNKNKTLTSQTFTINLWQYPSTTATTGITFKLQYIAFFRAYLDTFLKTLAVVSIGM